MSETRAFGLAVALAALAAAACDDPGSKIGGEGVSDDLSGGGGGGAEGADGADGTDGGAADGGAADGGASDGGTTDGGATDGGSADGGTTDGGTTDGGGSDGAAFDAEGCAAFLEAMDTCAASLGLTAELYGFPPSWCEELVAAGDLDRPFACYLEQIAAADCATIDGVNELMDALWRVCDEG
jgi:hypothetical protein